LKKATHHIGIIGAGPAGMATAIQLKHHGFKVTLFDAGISDTITIGEHLAAEAIHELKQLSIPTSILTKHSIPCSEVQNAWGRSEVHHNESIFNPFGDSYILSRPDFDKSLLDHCRTIGIQVATNTRIQKTETHSDQWKLVYDSGFLVVDFLVDASGRNSKFHFGHPVAKKQRKDALIGMTKYLKPKQTTVSDQSHLLVESTPIGWWYTAQIASGKFIATFMTDPTVLSNSQLRPSEFWKKAISSSHHTKERIASYSIPSETYMQSAHSQLASKVYGHNWAKVGDAAQSFDPLSSAGIIKGFKMGIACGMAITDYINGNKSALNFYAETTKVQYEEYIEQRDAYYQQELRWLDEPFWYHRVLDPKRIQQFSITPMHHLQIQNRRLKQKIDFLSEQLPEIQFDLLLQSISRFPLVKDAVTDYLNSQKNPSLNRWILHALESLQRIKAVEIL
jgi:flavin-dependent dehydrogenase